MTQTPSSTPEESFAASVRAARELRNWTQEELRSRLLESFDLDLSQTAMTRLENGRRPIRLNEVAALAKVLELDLAEYSGAAPPLGSASPPAQVERGEVMKQIASMEKLIAETEAHQARNSRERQQILVEEARLARALVDARLRKQLLEHVVAEQHADRGDR